MFEYFIRVINETEYSLLNVTINKYCYYLGLFCK